MQRGFGAVGFVLILAGIVLLGLLVVPRILQAPQGGLQPVSEEEANTATGVAFDAVRISHLKQYQTALELYYTEWETYPSTNGTDVVIGPDTEPCATLVPAGYLDTCLSDPAGETQYRYHSDGSTYALDAVLESDDSPYCTENADGDCVRSVTEQPNEGGPPPGY